MKNEQKHSNKIQNKLTKQEKEHLSNQVVLLTSFAILYAMLLLFFRRMCSYTATVNGARTFMEYLMWTSLAGSMLCAAWSAYKEKKGYYLYSAMFLFVFLSILLVLRINTLADDQAYAICFSALAMAVVLAQAYYPLRVSYKFKGWVKIAFFAVAFLTLAALIVATLEPRVWNII